MHDTATGEDIFKHTEKTYKFDVILTVHRR